ncbi:fatty acid amide hydrolase isoform X1 [Ziziphus jujuba]|uniref:Fatty acid amide hydrolase isoform X1 n=1 Tax=Ziziphus jujuba TaxID=326968 RepID=A0ABM3ZSE0_ZIZJJ|nr:fatty acid amide hydrolase isoform X1 [Ziziphus jujuba]XP_060667395.1 fatty acid amide hydrolase isoform X1 [Ziziphus jujuba]XP_060667396.1 fatty acid amide hydrolase isoform X1 [Ziziphus jujuba]XP_060667397.1 fatty acid amide hydrolase isoform X1 [Ziziphus jujuba]XP_060667398.1 fatty acid amide hydrolase isoform X1 [Ziziphus jujuba]
MGKKRVMVPVQEVDMSAVKYQQEDFQAPHLTGFVFKLFVWIIETPLIGPLIVSFVKKQNKFDELLQNTDIPEAPMFRPEFPPQEPEPGVVMLDEEGKPEERVELALKSLPQYDPASCWNGDSSSSFRYWKIRDYAYAYRSGRATPTTVAGHIISVIKEFSSKKPAQPLLISFDAEEVRKQAAASTRRFEEGSPLSILDGIFVAIKDDIDCYPHPSKGATTWMHEVRSVRKDAVCVSRLRSCGVIFVGKANMHELGMGTTGNNPNYGTTRNPHAPERYTGGSSSGPAAIVASGICSAALGTDGGGSVRIPSSLCGVVGLKTTYGRTDMGGSLGRSGTVEIIGPIASTVEDVMLVYSAILGSSLADRISLKPGPPCVPNISCDNSNTLGPMRLGKYTDWFNDVYSTDIFEKCDDALNLLSKTHGCEMVEIVVPELEEMRNAHLVSIGSEAQCSLNPDCEDGKGSRLTYDTRTSMALFRSFSAANYVAAQCLRRRIMYYHMEIFKKVDVIVTPTTGMTAPKIPSSALEDGETDLHVTGYLMRFVLAANLLGLPAITVPVGYDKQGLPIGLQLIGRPWAEASILRLASAIEELFAESKKRPVSYFDVLNG